MKQRTLIYSLLGSVALNVFLLGMSSVHLFSGNADDPRGRGISRDRPAGSVLEDARGPKFLRELVRAAGGPRDPRVKELWSGHRQHLRAIRQEIAESHERVLTALERDPFDREQLSHALNDALEKRRRADELASEGALQLAKQLTAEERQRVCREMREDEGRRPLRPQKRE